MMPIKECGPVHKADPRDETQHYIDYTPASAADRVQRVS